MELRLVRKVLAPPVTGAGERENSSHSADGDIQLTPPFGGASANQVLCNACGRGEAPRDALPPPIMCPTIVPPIS